MITIKRQIMKLQFQITILKSDTCKIITNHSNIIHAIGLDRFHKFSIFFNEF